MHGSQGYVVRPCLTNKTQKQITYVLEFGGGLLSILGPMNWALKRKQVSGLPHLSLNKKYPPQAPVFE